jgi:hypothetical protein
LAGSQCRESVHAKLSGFRRGEDVYSADDLVSGMVEVREGVAKQQRGDQVTEGRCVMTRPGALCPASVSNDLAHHDQGGRPGKEAPRGKLQPGTVKSCTRHDAERQAGEEPVRS